VILLLFSSFSWYSRVGMTLFLCVLSVTFIVFS
jgi:hypothetical protein